MAFCARWNWQRCQTAPGRTARRAAFSPAWSSLTTKRTPRMPRSIRLSRKARQWISASEGSQETLSTRRRPSGPIPVVPIVEKEDRMSQTQDTIVAALMEQLIAEGPEGMAQVFTTLFNLAMRLERERFLGAGLYERNPDRRGYANGYKSKTLDTTAGTVTVRHPTFKSQS